MKKNDTLNIFVKRFDLDSSLDFILLGSTYDAIIVRWRIVLKYDWRGDIEKIMESNNQIKTLKYTQLSWIGNL